MLEILQADFGSSRYDLLFEKIERSRMAGKKIYLVVPEQQTLLCESEAARRLPPSSALSFEVTNLSRLSNTVFRTEGGIAEEYADATVTSLLMWRTLSDLQGSLSSATRGTVGAGSVSKALRAVREMQSLGIDSSLLKLTAEGLSDTSGRLKNKLRDLSILMSTLSDLIQEKYADIAEDTGEMTRKLQDNPAIFEGAEFFFDGFTSFTEPQYVFLGVLMELCPLHVCLVLPKGCEEGFEFLECRETKKRLLTLAEDKNVAFESNALGTVNVKHEGLLALSRILWCTNVSLPSDDVEDIANSLKIVKTQSPHEEMAFLASDIRSRVMRGAKYSDFAVNMRNAESYRGFIDTAFMENGIPAFISGGKDVNSFEAVKLIRSAYRSVSGYFDKADVISYAKCPLSGITRDECDDFELYVEKWGINHGRFIGNVRWNMNPDGYKEKFTENGEAFLDRIDTIRHKIADPLLVLYNDSVGVHTVTQHAVNLIDFLRSIHMEESLENRAAELLQAGETELSEENERLYQKILSAVEKLQNTLGEFRTDSKTFTSLLDIAFSSMEIERIPAFVDEVTVGSADMIRLSKKKYVYLVGVNEGEFPALMASDSYFSEKEKQTLRDLGLKTEPDTDVKLSREYFIFSRAFLSGEDGVTLVYTEKNAAFGASKPSAVIDKIMTLTDEACLRGGIEKKNLLTVWRELPLAERVFTPTVGADLLTSSIGDSDLEALKTALAKTAEWHNIEVGKGEIENRALSLTKAGIDALYPGDITVSKSSLDSYRKCPMQHYLKYALGLSDKNQAKFDASNVGTLVHAVLETYMKKLKKEGKKVSDVTDEERQATVRTLVEEYLKGMMKDDPTQRQTHFFDKLVHSADMVTKSVFDDIAVPKENENAPSFEPLFFELSMDKHRQDLPEPLYVKAEDGTNIFVDGKIDRVDVLKDDNRIFVRVVDYKTGKDKFTRESLSEGENLQMFLYLSALVESKRFHPYLGAKEGQEVLPGCVMYMNTKLDAETASHPSEVPKLLEKSQTVSGMVNTDPTVLGAMNPKHPIVKITTKGAFNKRTADNAFTTDSWSVICDEVSRAVCKFATQMKSGNISAKPIENKKTCEYCSYAPICRSARK